jgi:arylsulfatase B
LGLHEKLISNYFKDDGYSTHLIGKWHLGYFQKKYTPTLRGFDSFYGYYNGLIDYYNYTYVQRGKSDFSPGLDFRRNENVNYDDKPGKYATDLFTNEAVKIIKASEKEKPFFLVLNHLAPHTGNDYDPFQAPEEEIEKFNHISDPNRRVLAGLKSHSSTRLCKKQKKTFSNDLKARRKRWTSR